MDLNIVNNATDVPFSSIVQDLLTGNVEKSASKQKVYKRMKGVAAINLPDIEAAVTLIFEKGKLTIEAGIVRNPGIIITTSYDVVTDLNLLTIRGGLPYYFDAPGRVVIGHLLHGRLKIKGMFAHNILLTRLTKLMSVM